MDRRNHSRRSSRKSRWDPANLALLQHATREKAAEAAGIDPATLYSWQKDPEFQKALGGGPPRGLWASHGASPTSRAYRRRHVD